MPLSVSIAMALGCMLRLTTLAGGGGEGTETFLTNWTCTRLMAVSTGSEGQCTAPEDVSQLSKAC